MRQNPQTVINQQTPIPQQIDRAMGQHLQQSLPNHLKQYVGADKPAYIPPRIERELNQQMQKNMPAHLKEYSGAYMQQHIIAPSATTVPASTQMTARPPAPDMRRIGHSLPGGEQAKAHWADLSNPTTHPSPASMSFAGQQQPQQVPQQPSPLQSQLPEQQYGDPASTNQPYHQQFDFIMSPNAPKQGGVPFMSGNKRLRVALLAVGALVILAIIGSLLSSLTKPKFDSAGLVSITQRQAEIVRIANIAATTSNSSTTLNSAYTIKLSVGSAEQQLVTYLGKNHVKVTPALLALKKDKQTDSQLSNAVSSSTFDSTFTDIMQTQLTTYQKALKAAYTANPGPTGRKLLTTDYNSVDLLLKQLQQK